VEKRWNILAFDEAKATALQQQLKISKRLCGVLVQRGIENFESSRDYFRPQLSMLHSPWLMKDMDKAVARLIAAFDNQQKILVFGDYDVDGTTAVASMYSFLSTIHSPSLLDFYIPHRYREGYGVSKAGIDHAAENGFQLIVCLDCGIKSVELIAYAASLGIDFIVCDHHLPGEELPAAAAILNPKQTGCEYPYKELCGCGVGFKLMTALTEALNTPEEDLYNYLDLVATAIAADIVPMSGENRVLAYFGLKKINEDPIPGIRSLVALSGAKPPLSITNVVFVIAPRVNAAGRMDDAKKAVQLFIEKDPVKALELAEMLHNDNAERKEADRSITAEALELMIEDIDLNDKTSTVVYREHWHKGVVGIVASRLIETHHRPTVVLTYSNGLATGSARSVPGFNLYEAIYACREFLVAYGGHFAAAGLSMLPEHVEPFRQKFETVVETTIDKQLLIPEIVIDTELDFTEIKEGFYNILTQMEPYGPQNMRPVFITRNVTDTGFSRILKEQHVRFSVKQKEVVLTGIGFNMANKFPLIVSKQPFDIVYTLDENEWNGTKNLQLKVIDVKISG
jgi:single-stranded-DNA-specific exonuclease